MDTLSVTAQLILGSILGAGAFVICRKAGLDPFRRETAFQAWATITGFAVAFVVLANLVAA
jgi:hypothetical protein